MNTKGSVGTYIMNAIKISRNAQISVCTMPLNAFKFTLNRTNPQNVKKGGKKGLFCLTAQCYI